MIVRHGPFDFLDGVLGFLWKRNSEILSKKNNNLASTPNEKILCP